MRVALYARVSTADKDQNPENQLVLLRREAERAGDIVVKEYVDEKSGSNANRPGFQQMLLDAGKRRFDVVRVFALDRFSREGIEAVWPPGPPQPVRRAVLELLGAHDEQHRPDVRAVYLDFRLGG